MQVLNEKKNLLDRLCEMSPEEGVKLMKQLFNPMRGQSVGFREGDRKEVCKVAEDKQDKVEKESPRRIVGSVATPSGSAIVYHRTEEADRELETDKTSDQRNKRS